MYKIRPILGDFNNVIYDNYVPEKMTSRKTYICGTRRSNRKDGRLTFPTDLSLNQLIAGDDKDFGKDRRTHQRVKHYPSGTVWIKETALNIGSSAETS